MDKYTKRCEQIQYTIVICTKTNKQFIITNILVDEYKSICTNFFIVLYFVNVQTIHIHNVHTTLYSMPKKSSEKIFILLK